MRTHLSVAHSRRVLRGLVGDADRYVVDIHAIRDPCPCSRRVGTADSCGAAARARERYDIRYVCTSPVAEILKSWFNHNKAIFSLWAPLGGSAPGTPSFSHHARLSAARTPHCTPRTQHGPATVRVAACAARPAREGKAARGTRASSHHNPMGPIISRKFP